MGRPEVVIGVDIGTTSAKAVAFTVDAEARASGRAGYALTSPAPGREEQDLDRVLAATLEATREAVRGAREAGHEVAGLALGAAMHALVGLDGSGAPVTPVLPWPDRRAAEQARRLREGPHGLALHRRTGTPVHPMSPLVKLRWFAEEEPGTAAGVAQWVGVKEPLLRALTGELVVDHGVASATGLLNLGDLDWDDEALGWAGIERRRLPALVPTTEVLRLSAEGGRLVGLPEGTPVVAGSGDGPLASLGLGAIAPGTAACSIGTSGALRVASDVPRVDERGRVFCYALAPGRWIVGGAINNGGIVLDWAGTTLAPDLAAGEHADRGGAPALLELAARAPPGAGGLIFLPHLLGERAPHWRTGARGAYVGLTRGHRREHLLRAAVEGVCLQLALVLGSLGEAGVDVQHVRATGGFSRSALWRSILASAFGRPIGFAASPEGSSLGAALLGMTSLGLLDSLERAAELVAVTEVERPDPHDAELYARLLAVFEAAHDALAASSEALADIEALAPPGRAGG